MASYNIQGQEPDKKSHTKKTDTGCVGTVNTMEEIQASTSGLSFMDLDMIMMMMINGQTVKTTQRQVAYFCNLTTLCVAT